MKMFKKYWWVLVLAFLVYKFWDKIAPMIGMKKNEPDTDVTAKTDVDDENDDLT